MDGSGFSPEMKRSLTVHVCSLPMRTLDQCNEVELLNIIEGDVAGIDKIIGIFFGTIGATFTLLLLLPVMATLSGELTCLIVMLLPIFFIQQARSGSQTAAMQGAVRKADTKFVQSIEENL
eukprot:815048-Prymnesium_polylepis.1